MIAALVPPSLVIDQTAPWVPLADLMKRKQEEAFLLGSDVLLFRWIGGRAASSRGTLDQEAS